MIWEFILRLSVAALLGAAIGLDREYRAKEAGLRTHFLVSMGSALFMIISQYGFSEILGRPGTSWDASRVAAQVVSGIGFIGAGTIIIQKQFVRGLTTAAGLWATSGIGLAVGGGMYGVGIAAAFLTLLGLEITSLLFRHLTVHSSAITFSTPDPANLQKIMAEIQTKDHYLVSYHTDVIALGEREMYRVSLIVKTKGYSDNNRLVKFIQDLPNVTIDSME